MEHNGDYTPVVTAREGVSTTLIDIGWEYWALNGFDEHCRPQWKVPVKKIDTKGYGAANVIAAAAVRAEIPGVTCSGCGNTLQLASRTSLVSVLAGDGITCVDCDAQLQHRISQLINPDERKEAKRQERLRQQQHKQDYEQARQAWSRQQRELVETTYATRFHPEAALPTAGVVTELVTLTMLRFAPSISPIPPVRTWVIDFPFHPTEDQTSSLLNDARGAGMITPAPSTRTDAFVWQSTFSQAYDAVGGDLDRLESPQFGDRYIPTLISWHVPYGADADDAVNRLDDHLAQRLDPAGMTESRQHELIRTAETLLAEEVRRYFHDQLKFRNLPEVSENHLSRLDEVITRALRVRPPGGVYCLAWAAVKTAAASAHSHLRAPKTNMTTYAVNKFEEDVQRASDDPSYFTRVFDSPAKCPLSAMTRTVFYALLELDPMTAQAGTLADHLPAPIAEPDPTPPHGYTEEASALPPLDNVALEYARTVDVGWPTAKLVLLLLASRAQLLGTSSDDKPGDVFCVNTITNQAEFDALAAEAGVHGEVLWAALRHLREALPCDVLVHDPPLTNPPALVEILYGPNYGTPSEE
ncbi:hypothetical protein [Actinopolyspora mortivallis]|uniref:hypothetical protein n=1 Tax=Actinopolyspora mortivallis TaxID=33906 RepID=UPI00036994F5|nr:hypothetical protein [Actinopolyspora mortivallis]